MKSLTSWTASWACSGGTLRWSVVGRFAGRGLAAEGVLGW
jgi:hypothetical protein